MVPEVVTDVEFVPVMLEVEVVVVGVVVKLVPTRQVFPFPEYPFRH